MGQRLARREDEIVVRKRPAEQDIEALLGRCRRGQKAVQLGQTLAMAVAQRIEPLVQPGERPAMRRQHQQIGWQQRAKPVDRGQPVAERIALRLDERERDLGPGCICP